MELHYQFTKYAQKGHIVNFCFVFVMFVVSIGGGGGDMAHRAMFNISTSI